MARLGCQAKIPPSLIRSNIWERRFEGICAFERYLSHNGIVIRKFFLNLSKAEQSKRFLARLEEPEKHRKFSASDINDPAPVTASSPPARY